jgi:drug/metabolite transporter (DMT)-like permease
MGLLFVIATALLSGVSNLVNAVAMKGANADAFVTLRNALVAALLVPVVVLARPAQKLRLRPFDWARLATIGLIGGAIPFVLFFRGIQLATAEGGTTTASFLYRMLFLLAAVFAVVFLRERLSARLFLAAILLLVGNALLMSFVSPIWTDGAVLVLAATALWAGEYTLSKRTLRDLPSSTVALGRMGFGAVFLISYIGLSGQTDALFAFRGDNLQWIVLSTILLLGFVVTWYAGLKVVDLSVATAVLILGYPVTWVFNLALGRESFGLPQAAGAAVVVLGVVLAMGIASLRDTWGALAEIVLTQVRGTKSP